MFKKITLIIITLIISIMFLGCHKKASYITDADEFDKLFSGALKYDIRDTSSCEEGHIPSFLCMGGISDNDRLVETIKISAESKDRVIIIISTGDDKARVDEIFKLLNKEKYYNLYSFEGGYENYVQLKGETFVPEVGCDC